MKVNDEAKIRRSARAEVLGKAKVMGFEELEAARAKRAEKDAVKEAKDKAKRDRKKALLEGETGEEQQQAATLSKVQRGRKRKGMSDVGGLKAKIIKQSEAQIENISSRLIGEDEVTRGWRASEAPMPHNRIP
ncbi:hypothetical protein BS50DRAFT_18554 [Corynespora cassiicola Philippines]|uniref:Uncharacterized protein n=1 Tax=Corynespora cassiicola Philippines TaxID=1448308 RepID=A0A2T2PA66_CORCC|nr:hypothetical protein BS50DRAFT_18554 [Corynespora cassiicola Philippines]